MSLLRIFDHPFKKITPAFISGVTRDFLLKEDYKESWNSAESNRTELKERNRLKHVESSWGGGGGG